MLNLKETDKKLNMVFVIKIHLMLLHIMYQNICEWDVYYIYIFFFGKLSLTKPLNCFLPAKMNLGLHTVMAASLQHCGQRRRTDCRVILNLLVC